MGDLVILSVGEDFHLMRGKDHIIYAGMPSEEVYSIVQRTVSGHSAQAWNLFYPRRQHDMTIDGVSILVDSVSPGEIRFRIR